MRLRTRAVLLVLLLAVASGALAASAGAVRPLRCQVAPFEWDGWALGVPKPPPGPLIEVVWRTTLANSIVICVGTGLDGRQVSLVEAAQGAWRPSEDGSRMRGRAMLGVQIDGFDGIAFEGRVTGVASCDMAAQTCQLSFEIEASSQGGSRLMLQQAATVDLANGTMTSDVSQFILEISGVTP